MFKKCLVGAGFVALVTVTLLVDSGISAAGPFARWGNRARFDYYPDSTVSTTDPSVQPYAPGESRESAGVSRRMRTRNYSTSTRYVYIPAGEATTAASTSERRVGIFRRMRTRTYSTSSPYIYVPAGGDTVTYSTSGYRPGDATNSTKGSEMPARLRIAVPSERAEVWIEGEKTEQSKRVQEYVSPPLTPNKQYYYEVRALWTDAAGKQVERKKSFPIVPGQPVFLDFTRSGPTDKEVIRAPKDENPNKK